MSHFTVIKTQIQDAQALVKALADLGFSQVEVHDTPQSLYGYQGDVRTQQAEVIIRRKHISRASNDIGFRRQNDGTFEAIISEYDRRQYSQAWINRVTQRYGYHTLMATAPEQGFAVESEEMLEDGTIRVVMGRWV